MVSAVTSLAETPLELYHWVPGRESLMNRSLKKLFPQIQMDQYQVLRILAQKEKQRYAWSVENEKRFHPHISTTIIRNQFQFSLATFSKFAS